MKNLVTILFLSLSFTLFAQETIDLFIWAGQSNALGRQGDAVGYPADVNNLDNQIRFNWTVANGNNSGGWTTMQPQVGYFTNGHFGPEVTFSRKLVQAGYNPAIFKYTQGATSMFQHWQGPGDGVLYDNMVINLNAAITALENQGHTVNIRGLVWIQGESDSNSQAAASAYNTNLTTLLNDFRNNVVNNANLPIILGVDEQFFNLNNHQQPEILNVHQDLALNDDDIKFTSMYGYPKADATHLTPTGLISHGEGLFDSFQLLTSGNKPLENCTLSSVGNEVSVERASWGQSFTTDCSGNLSSITFSAASSPNGTATFTLRNGADCTGTVLLTQTINSITSGDITVNPTSTLYLEKEHTYYYDITLDGGADWRINYHNSDNVFGMLRTSGGGTSCGTSFPSFDMNFSVVIATPVACADNTNIYSFTYDGKTYEVVKNAKSWADAAACAVERGGVLARINDASEQTAIWNELHDNSGIVLSNTVASNGGSASYVWIGGNDIASDGTWIWDGDNNGSGDQFWDGDTNGDPVGDLYSNWGKEPDNSGNQDGLAIALTRWPLASGSLGSAGQWNDLRVSDPLYYVIEYTTVLATNDFKKESVKVYPNPVDNLLTIKDVNYNIENIKVINFLGQIIRNVKPVQQSKSIQIDFSTINHGMYFINIDLENGSSIIKKVIK